MEHVNSWLLALKNEIKLVNKGNDLTQEGEIEIGNDNWKLLTKECKSLKAINKMQKRNICKTLQCDIFAERTSLKTAV